MMFVNFSSDIVSKIKLRSTKLVDYGKRREMTASLKQRIQLWLQPRGYRYVTISMVTIMWNPTVSHLLNDTKLVIKLSDNRAPGVSRGKSDLVIVSLPADKRFTITIPMTMSVPTAEMVRGIPLGISAIISSNRAKSGIEIGCFKITASVLGEKCAGITTVSKPEITYEEEEIGKNCEQYWLGMNQQLAKEGPILSLIENYLAGSGTLETLTMAIANARKL
ncbi:TPA_asm: P3 [Cuscuta gammacytorhabdovirus 2]|nr:TPA_asm: P3 [Cuscuta gammacytorhabdovirus 2]